jgi:predicted transposase YbfD/YdcC
VTLYSFFRSILCILIHFLHILCDIKDSRQSAKITYPLFDILFVSLCSVIAGAVGWKDIEEYAEGHLDWFQERGFLPHGVPVDDTISRIISRIEPDQFHQCFINWMQAAHSLTLGQLVAIDGKTLHDSYNCEDRLSTLHMVSAYACVNKVVIGQVITEEKSNEITAMPDLIKLLDIKVAQVPIDAMGWQTDIVKAIVAKHADYLLAVKGNQGSLYQVVQHAFAESLAEQEKACQIERSHGRIDARGYYVQDASKMARQFPKWKGLNTIGVVLSYRQVKGENAQFGIPLLHRLCPIK